MRIIRKNKSEVNGIVVLSGMLNKKNSYLGELKQLSEKIGWSIESELKRSFNDFPNTSEKIYSLSISGNKQVFGLVLILHDSKKKAFALDSFRNVGAECVRLAEARGVNTLSIMPSICSDQAATKSLIEGVLSASYKFTRYLSTKQKKVKSHSVDSITLLGANDKEAKAVNSLLGVYQGVYLARNLVNSAAADCNPDTVVKEAKEIAKNSNIKIKVLRRKELQAKKMAGILAVGRASVKQPAFIILDYQPRGASPKKSPVYGIIGKGVTFDSGGLSIKPASGMETMKGDMAGAAVILGIFKALSILKPKVRIKGYIPVAENMINGDALRPGDIISYSNGKTVEVLNTDAEGRLILADALIYADRDGCDQLIDLATLTGSVVVALGPNYAGLFTNDNSIKDGILKSSDITGERMWPMPLASEYEKLLKSPIADLKNIGGQWGGSITAALFLKHFVQKTPWAHIDIAGPAFTDSQEGSIPRGGTGFGIRMLLDYFGVN